MVKENRLIIWIGETIFVIFAIILIIQLILKITGHSPSDVQLLYIIVGGIFSYLLVANYKIGIFVGEMREFKEITKESFVRLKEDLKRR